MGVALGHVRRREPRDDAPVTREIDQDLEALAGGEQIAVDKLHALRRSGRAGRVDEGEHVGRLDLGDRSLEVEAGVRALDIRQRHDPWRRIAVDDDHVLEVRQASARLEHLRQVLLLADQQPRVGVGDDVLDLVRRVCAVDGERRRAEHHRGEIAEMELRPVGQHQRDRLTASEPELGEAPREVVDATAQLGPRDRELVTFGADRHLLGPFGGRQAEGLRERRRPGGGTLRRAQFRDRAIHVRSSRLAIGRDEHHPRCPGRPELAEDDTSGVRHLSFGTSAGRARNRRCTGAGDAFFIYIR